MNGRRRSATQGRPAALRRLPRLRWHDPPSSAPVGPADADRFPALADDLQVLSEELEPVFVDFDRRALREQNRFRRQQVLLFAGSLTTTVLGAVQAALGGTAWPGWLVAVTGGFMTALTFVARHRSSHLRYLETRLQAEQLRGLFFRYLGRMGPFAGDDARRRNALAAHVEMIRTAVPPDPRAPAAGPESGSAA